MRSIIDYVYSSIINHSINTSFMKYMIACVNGEMIVNGWISLFLSNEECIMMNFKNGIFMNEGYVLNEKKVIFALNNFEIGDISDNKELVVEGIADLDSGTRFEGRLLKEREIRIPFGFGEMYDDDGKLRYKGIMINWKRFGYGVSYHYNGVIEYEGYWCNNNRCGSGKVFDLRERIIKECNWYNGYESDIDNYEGDGNRLSIAVEKIKLSDNCVLKDWDISLFYNLESIEVGNNCFKNVETFKIDGLHRLRILKIGKNSFTQLIESYWRNNWDDAFDKSYNPSKSFHILDCESLESIEIGEYSFSDFAGQFELKNLPSLQSIQIGTNGSKSRNFYWSSFVIRGIISILTTNV